MFENTGYSVQYLFSFNYCNYIKVLVSYKWFTHPFIKQVSMKGYYVPDSFSSGADDTLLRINTNIDQQIYFNLKKSNVKYEIQWEVNM